jgi:hypothetical protein
VPRDAAAFPPSGRRARVAPKPNAMEELATIAAVGALVSLILLAVFLVATREAQK